MRRMDWLRKIKKTAGKEWLLASLVFSVMTCICVYFFVHVPMRQWTETARAETKDARQVLSSVEQYRAEHVDEHSYEKALLERQERADKALPDTMEQGVFLATLQRLAFQHKIKLTQVTPKAVAVREGLHIMPVEVKFRSSYFELLSFLRSLREEERFIQVTRTSVQEKDGALNCMLELRVYALTDSDKKDKI